MLLARATDALEEWWTVLNNFEELGISMAKPPNSPEPTLPDLDEIFEFSPRDLAELYQRYVGWAAYYTVALGQLKARDRILAERVGKISKFLYPAAKKGSATIGEAEAAVESHELMVRFGRLRARTRAEIDVMQGHMEAADKVIAFISRVITIREGDRGRTERKRDWQ